jgi:hypothetical protein
METVLGTIENFIVEPQSGDLFVGYGFSHTNKMQINLSRRAATLFIKSLIKICR